MTSTTTARPGRTSSSQSPRRTDRLAIQRKVAGSRSRRPFSIEGRVAEGQIGHQPYATRHSTRWGLRNAPLDEVTPHPRPPEAPTRPGDMAMGRSPRLIRPGKRPHDPDTWLVGPGTGAAGALDAQRASVPKPNRSGEESPATATARLNPPPTAPRAQPQTRHPT